MSRLEFDKPENVFFEFDRKMLTSFIDKISHVNEKKSYVENLNFGFDRKLLTSFINKISHVSEKKIVRRNFEF